MADLGHDFLSNIKICRLYLVEADENGLHSKIVAAY